MIGVIDLGMGNLRSVLNAFGRLDHPARLVGSPEQLHAVDRLVLPGVGAFGDAVRRLAERGLAEAIQERADAGIPLLGICLGMQLLGTCSFEYGRHDGLDLIPGAVRRLEPSQDLRVPHVGWNSVRVHGHSRLLTAAAVEPTFYFVHSFQLVPDSPGDLAGTADYGGNVTAAVERDGIFGAQFHPEKSQRDGLALLDRFARL